jgi:hypothetical protein
MVRMVDPCRRDFQGASQSGGDDMILENNMLVERFPAGSDMRKLSDEEMNA